MDVLKAKGFIDDSRMCVSGWSYGGYMTTWMTGHYPDLWKCAVTGASVTNRIDQHELQRRRRLGSAYTSPQNMEREMAQSPISMVSKVKAPTLILHDTGDYRVAITESFEWFHALAERRDGAVHRVSGVRPQPDRSGASARRAAAMDRVDADVSSGAAASGTKGGGK